MLVLSRRAEEKIVFPQAGITVHVLGTQGAAVRIGVEAPPDVKILRGELAETQQPPKARRRPKPSHALRNRLNTVGLLAHVLERQWAAGRTADAKATLRKLTQAVDSLDRDFTEKESGGPAVPKTPAKRRTLVVEDDAIQRELLAGLLSLNGVECDVAEDGQAALDFLKSHDRPDFVLLDMWMPRCDGPETVARIRRDPKLAGLKIFIVSATAPADLGLPAGTGGVDGWFTKPINPQTLWESIQKHLADASIHN
ncbi:MAG TPA: response regulator [Gemmataceae bacterium]|nr:response regulator [Gemmataceae bacterium]